ncbi:MAG TPA: MFS transporter [Steroidobacteraceae bacterium]|jgi:MFS family permease
MTETARSNLSPYLWYVTAVFALFFALSFADRQIIGVVAEPMKAALQLTDVQIGIIGGLGFVVFFVFFGLPLGRLADTRNRKWLIVAGVIIWSTSTVLCGLATRFWELLILRMGVGLGEATLGPCAYSILADIFPRNRLAMALSFCTMAGALGMGLAYSGGGMLLHWAIASVNTSGTVSLPLLGDQAPWRVVFVGVGLPGLILSALLFTIREPARPATDGRPADSTLSEVISYVQSNWRTFVMHNVGMGFISITGYTASLWDIALFARTYHWPASESGRFYGLMAMAGSILGALSGGWIADWLTRTRGRDAKLLVLAATAALCIPIRLLYPLMPTRELALGLAFVAVTLVAVPYGVAASALQIMAPSRMRGQLTAVYFFVQSLIGLGIGPTMVGLLTDHVFRDPQMLRYSLIITGGTAQILAAVLFLLALRPYQTTLINALASDRGGASYLAAASLTTTT